MILLKKLVKIPSFSGKEEIIQKFIFSWLIENGLKPKWQKENVVLRILGIKGSKAIIFNAHVDTVGLGDQGLWENDPFAGKVVDGKLYGLGASDEKAGVASLMQLAEKLGKEKPFCDVWFTFVVKEELDGSGTKKFLDWFLSRNSYDKLSAVLVEPTGLECVELGHKGNAFIKLTVYGDSGHGSQPERIKTNSVLLMAEILQKMVKLNEEWKQNYFDEVLGIPTIGVGTSIVAGDQSCPNKFAEKCEAILDVRTIPEMHSEAIELIKESLKNYPVKVDFLYESAPIGLTEASDPIVLALQRIKPEVELGVSKGSTDQCFFTQKGIPTAIIGPGEKECIHKANEYCVVKKIGKAVDIYNKLIEKWSKEA